jgi:2-methylcitrate dehydratase PrpD
MSDETRALARFAATITRERIPPRVQSIARDLLVDQIGCQIGCAELPWGRQVRTVFSRWGGTPEATVVRFGDRLPMASAAFVNSTFGQSFEYDDVNAKSSGHPGAELIPPLLAIAERHGFAGRDLLTAFIVGYEVRGRIGYALSTAMLERGGPQYSTTCGPFGVAAGAGRLLRLDAEGIRNAIAIAGSYAGGLMQYDHGGGSVKRIHPAIAAMSGMQSTQLAVAGMTGPDAILEGPRGLLRIYSPAYLSERLIPDVEGEWIIEHALFKPYPCGAAINPAIDGLKALMAAHQLRADDIEWIEIGYPKRSYDHVTIPEPHDVLGMQFSTAYCLALAAVKGGNTPHEYSAEALADPEVRRFAAKVRIREDGELTQAYEGRLPARVRVGTRAGVTHEDLQHDARGSPGAPLSSADIDQKFRGQVASVLGTPRCDELLRALRGIDTVRNVRDLIPLLLA